MMRQMCKSKIHRATVTDANLHYVGSITIDRKLLEAADILPYEMVQVVNINNGNRFETYAIEGPADSGVICLNGAAARLVAPGDIVIIIAYGLFDNKEAKGWTPHVVHVNEKNQMIP
ncbi:MAG TPA: aspartate 1-decarboxylase [Bacillota bacterium]|nr:aspartate 1-decarboxylase [Bacillota bacterium]